MMMKSTTKKSPKTKLNIKREQLRILGAEQLTFVAGGMMGEDSIRTGVSSCTGCG